MAESVFRPLPCAIFLFYHDLTVGTYDNGSAPDRTLFQYDLIPLCHCTAEFNGFELLKLIKAL